MGQGEGDDTDGLTEAIIDVYEWRQTHAYPLALVTPGVRNWVSQETAGDVVVGQRLKRFDRMLDKLERLTSMRLTQMEDIAGCRAVVLSTAEVDAVARRIRSKWDVRSEGDYREDGKDLTGYRCLHLVVMRRERLVEIQLRTPGQHNWAEVVERTSSRLGFRLKDGHGPSELIAYFRVASHIIWRQENAIPIEEDLSNELANLRVEVGQYFQRDARPRRRRRRLQ